jgi:putative sigma-54 modulation protein
VILELQKEPQSRTKLPDVLRRAEACEEEMNTTSGCCPGSFVFVRTERNQVVTAPMFPKPYERPLKGGLMVHISIRHRNVFVDDIVKASANEKITRLSRFVQGMDTAEVCFTEEQNPRVGSSRKEICEATMRGHGHVVRAKAAAATQTAALDLVVAKLEHQLLKVKGKVGSRLHGGPKAGNHHSPGLHEVPGGTVALLEQTAVAEADPNEAKIVRRKQFEMDAMSAEDAALRMDLLQHDFYMFTNAETGRSAVVYRREDGHLGLIDAAA